MLNLLITVRSLSNLPIERVRDMAGNNNNGIERLLGKLIERTETQGAELRSFKEATHKSLAEIQLSLGTQHQGHSNRISKVELVQAEYRGGTKILVRMATITATIGGIIGSIISRMWWS